MNCKQCEEVMMNYFDRVMKKVNTAEFQKHLFECDSCSEQFRTLSEMLGSLEQVEELDPPQEIETKLMEKIHAYVDEKEKKSKKVQTALHLGILCLILFPVSITGMVLSNLSLYEVVVTIGNYMDYFLNYRTLNFILSGSFSEMRRSFDFLTLKVILAAGFIFIGLYLLAKTKSSTKKVMWN